MMETKKCRYDASSSNHNHSETIAVNPRRNCCQNSVHCAQCCCSFHRFIRSQTNCILANDPIQSKRIMESTDRPWQRSITVSYTEWFELVFLAIVETSLKKIEPIVQLLVATMKSWKMQPRDISIVTEMIDSLSSCSKKPVISMTMMMMQKKDTPLFVHHYVMDTG